MDTSSIHLLESAGLAQPVDIRERLRAATSAAHVELEEKVDIAAKVGDAKAYRDLLTGFLGFYRPLEERLAMAGLERWGYHQEERRKSGWLEEDLEVLGAGFSAGVPSCVALPEVETAARAMGCAYVLEGSTLGGRHISRMFDGSPVPPEARRFFHGYGAETGARWTEFCGSLQDFGGQSPDPGEILTAATETFRCLAVWLATDRQIS
jgi:heme oxygenase (biliverdin-IX-beta and delta-forming)